MAALKKFGPWIVAISVLSGTFMEVLDTSIANVSLPHIAGSLSATPEEASWVLTSYLVANGIVLPVTAWLAGYFGRKNYLLFSVAVFTVASALSGAAHSLPMLIFFRTLQGLGGGGLQPLSQAILMENFPPEKRGQAMALYGLGVVVAPILGPTLGGWITDNYTWRWIFYINLPVGFLSFLLISWFVEDPPYIRKTERRIDFFGFGLLAVGIGALQYVLDRGQEKDWFGSPMILRLFILSIVALVVFVIWELKSAHPIVNLRIFKNRTYAMGDFLIFLLGFALFGNLVVLPLFLQIPMGYSALQAGLVTSPRGIGSFLAMPIAGFLISVVDSRYLVAAGATMAGLSIIALSHLNLQVGYWNIFWPQIFQGFSMAFLFVPLTTIALSTISKEEMGNATSLFNLLRNLGGSIGISLATTVLARSSQAHQVYLSAHLNSGNPAYVNRFSHLSFFFAQHGFSHPMAGAAARSVFYRLLLLHSNTMAYLDSFLLFGLSFFIFIPFLFLMEKPKGKSQSPMAH